MKLNKCTLLCLLDTANIGKQITGFYANGSL